MLLNTLCKHSVSTRNGKRTSKLDLILKTMAFVKFLKTENLTKNIWEFYVGWVLTPIQPQLDTMQMLTQALLKFWSIYSFQDLTAVTVFNIKPLNFQNILSLTCSFHFWHLQSANIRFSINS